MYKVLMTVQSLFQKRRSAIQMEQAAKNIDRTLAHILMRNRNYIRK